MVLWSAVTAAQEPPPVPQGGLTSWKVVRAKEFPNYKVEILERWTTGKLARVDSMKARIIPKDGGSVTEFTGTWLTPDPKEFVADWQAGQVLDLTGDGMEDLVLRNSSGGAHCCYSYIVFSLGKPLQKITDIDFQDCGEKIRLYDLNGNGKPEIMTCDARFTYLGKLPYSESPFPPAIYTLGMNGYERADKDFKQVFLTDIGRQRQTLAKGYRPAAALQIVTDYLLMGDAAKAWEEFDKLYQGDDKEEIKTQLMQKLGLLQAPQLPPETPGAPPQKGPPAAPPQPAQPAGSAIPPPLPPTHNPSVP